MSSPKCPMPSELKKELIRQALENFKTLDKKQFPFILNKENLEKQINKVPNMKFLKTLAAAKDMCPTGVVGGGRRKKGGGIVRWVVYLICILFTDPDDFTGQELQQCYDILDTPVVVPSAEVAAPSVEPQITGELTTQEVDALSHEEYENYENTRLANMGGRRKRKSRKKKRRKIRETRKRKGGNSLGWKKLRKEAPAIGANKIFENRGKEISDNVKRLQTHFDYQIKQNLPKTEKAIEERKKKQRVIYKEIPALARPPRVEPVKNTKFFGFRDRSYDEIDALTDKKQKKSDKKFRTKIVSELNKVITDPSHPNYFNYRRKRILEIIQKKNLKEYNRFNHCKGKPPGQQGTGCSKEIYESIENKGQKRGKDLLDTIAKKYGISPKDEKYKKVKKTQKKGGRKKRRTKKRKKSRKRR